MVSTIQRQDQEQYGASYKVAPMSNYKVMNKMSCFLVKGVSEAPVEIQATLPNLTNFQVNPKQSRIRTCTSIERIFSMKTIIFNSLLF